MNVAAVILSYRRISNIPIIIESLQSGRAKPDEIIVIDNNPEGGLQVGGVTLIRCSRNFGCQIRHALAQVSGATHCLFMDDDLTVGTDTLRSFIDWGTKFPQSVLGHFGVVVDRQAEGPYSRGKRIHSVELTEVDVVLGRIHFCRVDKLAQAFTIFNMVPDYPAPDSSVEDDILLGMANRHYGYKNYVIPVGPRSTIRNLSEFGMGLSTRKNHVALRDRATRLLLDLTY